jgi:hypothetical protein
MTALTDRRIVGIRNRGHPGDGAPGQQSTDVDRRVSALW